MNDDHTRIESAIPPTAMNTPDTAADATMAFSVPDQTPVPPPGYEILGLIGRGGMGVVYRARQQSLNRVVALKTIELGRRSYASAAARFEQEAQTIARLQHPHIVTAYDFGRYEDRLFLTMEYVQGQDAESFIRERGQLDESTMWNLLRQAAAGLAHAASQGIVHRDVKPANMLLVAPPAGMSLPDGLPMLKLTDFGLAFLADNRGDARLTQEGTTLGSPHYMAPEQVVGGEVDLRTDIYGLGATAYHMLTGQPPFQGSTAGQVLANKLKGKPLPISSAAPQVSQSTCELIERMMHDEQEHRPGSYSELIQRIDEALQAKSLHAPRAPLAKASGRAPDSRRRTILWTSAIAVLALPVCGYYFLPNIKRPATVERYVPSGWAAPLFDGTTLRGWLPLNGQWSPGRDAEGGRVIRGSGTLERTLPEPDQPQARKLQTYRVSVNCDLASARDAELQFGFCPSEGRPRYVLRLDRDAIRFGVQPTSADSFREIASAPRPAAPQDPDTPHYVELRAERHAEHWVAFQDGKPFATAVPVAEGPPKMGLVAQGGEAAFDSPLVTELRLP